MNWRNEGALILLAWKKAKPTIYSVFISGWLHKNSVVPVGGQALPDNQAKPDLQFIGLNTDSD